MRKSVNRAMFETAQLMIQQNAALTSNSQARAPVETPLTPEQQAAKARRENISGWQALHERYAQAGSTGSFTEEQC